MTRVYSRFAGILFCVTCSLSVATDSLAKESPGKSGKSRLTPREIFAMTAGPWSGDIFLLPKRGNSTLESREFDPEGWHSSSVAGRIIPPHPVTMHGVAWDYDLRIPIVFYDPRGAWFKPGVYERLAVQQDIVPTLAAILDIPPPAKKTGRVLMESLRQPLGRPTTTPKPKAIVIFVQDQVGRQYFAAHPGKAAFYESLMAKGANYINGSVAHVDVETSVGHAGVGTGAWPSEHGVAGNNFFHPGIWRQTDALAVQLSAAPESKRVNPNFLFTPSLSDVWSMARAHKPVILSVAPAPRASIPMGGHGTLFKGGVKTAVTWLDEARKDGVWATDEDNYRLPESFKEKPLMPWVKKIVDHQQSWRGHKLIGAEDKLKLKIAVGTPALVRQQGELTRAAIQELAIGQDDETDLVWLNSKSTDYCGHMFGFESDECGEVLAAADEESKMVVDLIDRQTGGNYLVVLTADHGAAPLPELSGGYRLDRSKLKEDINVRFDRRDNQIDVVHAIGGSQVYLNRGELAANGFKIGDVVAYIKRYKATMTSPYNVLADEWIKKGKPREALFFEDVVAREDLSLGSGR